MSPLVRDRSPIVCSRPRWAPLMSVLALSGMVAPAVADDLPQHNRRTPVVEVFEHCRDAVVNISTTRTVRVGSLRDSSFFFDFAPPRRERVQSVGSGVIVHSLGLAVTNAHVVNQTSDVMVTFADGRTAKAYVVATDIMHDLALLRIDTDERLPTIKLGRSADLMVGETVVAIGNPLGLQHTVTAGIVSALNRELPYSREVTYTGLIQTDAAINPGNSGGPLFNINGQLIGINTAIRGDAQNVGFAIPVDHLWDLLPLMLDIERSERVRFGLRVWGPDARVAEVAPQSPAARAGLQVGDLVRAMDGRDIDNGIDYYVRLLAHKAGDAIRISYDRNGSRRDARIPLEVVPPPNGYALAEERFGLRVAVAPENTVSRIEARLGLRDLAPPLIVESVERGSPAALARIEPGDVILRIDRGAVNSLDDVGMALERVTPGTLVDFELLRWDSSRPTRYPERLRAR